MKISIPHSPAGKKGKNQQPEKNLGFLYWGKKFWVFFFLISVGFFLTWLKTKNNVHSWRALLLLCK